MPTLDRMTKTRTALFTKFRTSPTKERPSITLEAVQRVVLATMGLPVDGVLGRNRWDCGASSVFICVATLSGFPRAEIVEFRGLRSPGAVSNAWTRGIAEHAAEIRKVLRAIRSA